MSNPVFYRDILFTPEEDPVFTASHAFYALHGYIRAAGASAVVIPFMVSGSMAPRRLPGPGEVPEGLRVLSESRGDIESIRLEGVSSQLSELDAVQTVLAEQVEKSLTVRVFRVRPRNSKGPAALRRMARRLKIKGVSGDEMQKRLDEFDQYLRQVHAKKDRPGRFFFWMPGMQRRYPLFVDIEVIPENAKGVSPFRQNKIKNKSATGTSSSYGFGVAPLLEIAKT